MTCTAYLNESRKFLHFPLFGFFLSMKFAHLPLVFSFVKKSFVQRIQANVQP